VKIHNQKNGKLNDADRLALAALLIKAGYTVRIIRVKEGSQTVNIVETVEDGQ
jgi:hypothetical protein